MNRQLAEAVIATFREESSAQRGQRLQRFTPGDWQRTFHWLDASGLALYFLDAIRSAGIEDALPLDVLQQLDQRFTDNQLRTASLFRDFASLNSAFQKAGLRYVNLKGFTLLPEYCADPALRFQIDCDFLVAHDDASRCSDLLLAMGYCLTGRTDHVMEFKMGTERIPHIRDLYKTKPQRSVEIHLTGTSSSTSSQEIGLIERSQTGMLNGLLFPRLAAPDMVLSQAAHLFRHVRSEWTRTSWLLEFSSFVSRRQHDHSFWAEIQSACKHRPDLGLAVGVSAELAARTFGFPALRRLADQFRNEVPSAVKLWIDRYGRDTLVRDYPGSKLYLLLELALQPAGEAPRTVRRRLFPVHRPPRMAFSKRGYGDRLLAHFFQLRYLLFRLRFHVAESSRYMLEAWRWKRIVDASG